MLGKALRKRGIFQRIVHAFNVILIDSYKIYARNLQLGISKCNKKRVQLVVNYYKQELGTVLGKD